MIWSHLNLIYFYISEILGGKSKFSIDERYPVGVAGETPSILLERGKHVNFSCSSLDDFNACQWRGPFSGRDCQIFGE